MTLENQVLEKRKSHLATQIIQNILIKLKILPMKNQIKKNLLLKEKKSLKTENDLKIFLLKNIEDKNKIY